MKAEIRLTEAEVLEACRQYVESQGWNIEGKSRLDITPGHSDPRETVPASVEFVASVRSSGRARP